MAKYLHRFDSENEFQAAYNGEDYLEPWVSYTEETSAVTYNKVHINYQFVDMGSSSGILWADRNVGAVNIEDCGDRFAWAEVTPKNEYRWENYRYFNENYAGSCAYSDGDLGYNGMTKYIYNDNKALLDPTDDAATVNMGSDCQMPPYEAFDELLNNSTVTSGTVNGVSGYVFTSNINGNQLFFPYDYGYTLIENTNQGCGNDERHEDYLPYWHKGSIEDNITWAKEWTFAGDGEGGFYYDRVIPWIIDRIHASYNEVPRYVGLPVRGIKYVNNQG